MARYQTLKNSGSNLKKILNVLNDSFDSHVQLQNFVRESMGNSVYNSTNWNNGLQYVMFEVVCQSEREGYLGKLLEAVQQEQPENTEVSTLIAQLVADGVLKDTTK